MSKIRDTGAWSAMILIRLAVGLIFLSEGIQKFLYPLDRGAGRFEKIGIPAPEFFGPFVGTLEIVCGILVLVGFYTRLAAIPLIIIMCVAISTTKIIELPEKGFWEVAHSARTDFSMLLSSLFLLITGGGKWSIDFNRQRKL